MKSKSPVSHTFIQHVCLLLIICGSVINVEMTDQIHHPATPSAPSMPSSAIPATVHPPGHLKPLGSHRPPEEPGVEVRDSVPTPWEFFNSYIKKGKPVVFKGAARGMPAFQLWTDEYLSDQYGHIVVEVEEGKKENRSKNLWQMPLSSFIEEYQEKDMYLVTDVPTEMSEEYCLLRCLLCSGLTQVLMDTIIWYSSGGTKSVLHYDGLDNINCVLDGRKEIFLVDKREEANVDIDHPEGSFSGVDVDRVDLNRYPGLSHVPWYNVTMEKGDCLFIPYRWFHHVRSTGRNLAVNVWFAHLLWLDESSCHGNASSIPDFMPLSRIETRAHATEPLRSEIANKINTGGGTVSFRQLDSLKVMPSMSQEKLSELFELLDTNMDHLLTLEEIYTVNFAEACSTVGLQFHGGDEDGYFEEDDDDEEEDDDTGENDDGEDEGDKVEMEEDGRYEDEDYSHEEL